MADDLETLLQSSSSPSPPRPSQSSTNAALIDEEDESSLVPDFLALKISTPGSSGKKIPSRGIKDFEPHGTKLQVSTLEASRNAMYNVLKEERMLMPGTTERAFLDLAENGDGGAWCERGGKWASGVGRTRRVCDAFGNPRFKEPQEGDDLQDESVKVQKKSPLIRLYLLPEEALWLVERGSLDLRWPTESGDDEFAGMPVAVQSAHAILLGRQGKNGMTLEKFLVYQYLKRAGYVVMRAEDNWHNVPTPNESDGQTSQQAHHLPILNFWRRLFASNPRSESEEQKLERQRIGPLVKPGLYRDFGMWKLVDLALSLAHGLPKIQYTTSRRSYRIITP
jgi:tRNA-splicing endonuclease subunit Sen54